MSEVAKVISISNEVYAMLAKLKGERSFSETIKEAVLAAAPNGDVSELFGTIDRRRARAWIKEVMEARGRAGQTRGF